ncbi:MAG TPA: hypothetical protein VMZ30_01860, partial [Pyrinomonadaceae bacterium]|nr:hypothetical protein [Pyrinomonadaceae bacterium]
QQRVDSLFGSGFYSFWDTQGAQDISSLFMGSLKTVHNGFIEMSLDCGFIGLALLILLLASWARKSIAELLSGSTFGAVALTLWLLAIVRNFSETEYFRPTPLWFTVILMMIRYPGARVGDTAIGANTSENPQTVRAYAASFGTV